LSTDKTPITTSRHFHSRNKRPGKETDQQRVEKDGEEKVRGPRVLIRSRAGREALWKPHFLLVSATTSTCNNSIDLDCHLRNMPPQASPDRALQAIIPLIASGKAYEAHQKARTFGSRYLKAHAYDIAIQVIFPSARELLKAGHAGSGSDLALFLIGVYIAKEQPVDATSRGVFPARSRVAQPRRRVLGLLISHTLSTLLKTMSRSLLPLQAQLAYGGKLSSIKP
jgi:hypothetical protein